ncbi:MAG: single-stranded DNA-binding protein [Paludibacter sp.]|nr:single-stranded DNA-binding protein [Paludibacter sp.]MDD4198118.1 single-stranded DNA-binding protein [Paludibacter sp.]MDD4427386.1 single-stranded DNA-binding protein [Paludibacter sp.]
MSVNKVILVGNAGKDPEVRYLDKNVAVANFPLATTERGFTMQNGTQVPDRTEWHNIVAWRGLAEIAEKYIRKGSQLYIEGKIQSRSWEKDGIKRYITEIYAENIQLLGKKTETGESQAPVATQQPAAPAPEQPVVPPEDEEESGLPF